MRQFWFVKFKFIDKMSGGMEQMESLAVAFANTLGRYVSKEIVVFIISMIPILELRGGLIVSKLLQVPITTAIPICIVGNIIPIPFILLFIKQIFKLLKK